MCWRGCGLLRLLLGPAEGAALCLACSTPATRPPPIRSCSRPTRGQRRRRLAGSGEARPLAVLDRSFRLLVCEPAPLALDGFAVDGLPDRPIPLDELRGMLLHPSVGFDTRDTALTWLVGRAQTEGGAWLVGLAGVLLPGIGRRVYPLCRAFPRLAHDLEAEALAGLLQAVQGWRWGRTGSRPGWSGRPPGPRIGCCAARPRWLEREASVGLDLEPPARPASPRRAGPRPGRPGRGAVAGGRRADRRHPRGGDPAAAAGRPLGRRL